MKKSSNKRESSSGAQPSSCPFESRLEEQSLSDKFDKLVAFLRKYRRYPESYRRYSASRSCVFTSTSIERITEIYFSALNSNRSGSHANLEKWVKEYRRRVGNLSGGKLSREQFLKLFGAKDEATLFVNVTNAGIGLKNKKAALFLRDLFETQKLETAQRIFRRQIIEPTSLRIPLDSVIAGVLNELFGRKPRPLLKNGYAIDKHFEALTFFAKTKLEVDFMLIEDLWFWGYFGSKGATVDGGFGRQFVIRKEIQFRDPFFTVSPVPDRAFKGFHACFS